MTTPLFHTQIAGGPTGLSFQIGPLVLFTSPDDEQIYIVHDPACCLTMTPVPPSMAATLIDEVIEPRLHTLLRQQRVA